MKEVSHSLIQVFELRPSCGHYVPIKEFCSAPLVYFEGLGNAHIMKNIFCIIALSLAISVVPEAFADEIPLRVQALRAARKVFRSEGSPEISTKANTNFQGVWGGRYIFYPGGSSCPTNVTSIDFRHALRTRGASGYLATNHAGGLNGRSRDRGRRWEFLRTTSFNGRQAAVLILYQSLARDGRTAGTGMAFTIRGGCTYMYVANAIRLGW